MVVLGHGVGGSPADWSPLVEGLQHRAQLITFALAGSAEADPASFSPSRHASVLGFADDLAQLCADLALRGAIYIGHSLSGMAGVLASIADPGLFRRLILINASARYLDDPLSGYRGGFSSQQVESMLASIASDYGAWASGFGPLVMGNPERPEFGTEFARSLKRLDPTVAAVTFRAAFTSDFRHLMPRLSVPTLVLQSQADPAVPIETAQWLAAAIPGARFAPLHCSGHFPHLVAPAELMALIAGELSPP